MEKRNKKNMTLWIDYEYDQGLSVFKWLEKSAQANKKKSHYMNEGLQIKNSPARKEKRKRRKKKEKIIKKRDDWQSNFGRIV